MTTLTENDLRRYPEYVDAESEWLTAQSVARKGQDEAAELRAQLAWFQRRQEITERISTEVSRKERLSTLVEQAKKDHPFVPTALYEAIQDPDQLEKVVKDLAAEFEKAQANQGWSPGSGPGEGSGVARRTAADERRKLIDKANTGDKPSLAEFRKKVWEEHVTDSPFVSSSGRRSKQGANR